MNNSSIGGVGGATSSQSLGGVEDQVGDPFDIQDPLNSGASQMQFLLELQAKVAQQTMAFQALTSTLKARTDAAKAAARNIQ